MLFPTQALAGGRAGCKNYLGISALDIQAGQWSGVQIKTLEIGTITIIIPNSQQFNNCRSPLFEANVPVGQIG